MSMSNHALKICCEDENSCGRQLKVSSMEAVLVPTIEAKATMLKMSRRPMRIGPRGTRLTAQVLFNWPHPMAGL